MNQNRFSDRLRFLMKERKISGQKIADAIKMSQKTISRYATGEREPNEDTQKKILQAIGEISGHPADGESVRRTLPTTLGGVIDLDTSLLISDEEIINIEDKEIQVMLDSACRTFSSLNESNQKLFIEHFSIFVGLNSYEIVLLELFAQVSEEDRDYIIENMEIVRVGLKEMLGCPSTCKKIADYMQMIQESKKVKFEDIRKFSNIPEEYRETEIIKVFRNRLDKEKGICVEIMDKYLPELITIDSRDWYFLMLVQMLSLKDRGGNITYYGDFVGDKVYALIGYMEKLVDKIETRV